MAAQSVTPLATPAAVAKPTRRPEDIDAPEIATRFGPGDNQPMIWIKAIDAKIDISDVSTPAPPVGAPMLLLTAVPFNCQQETGSLPRPIHLSW
ncbi:MAG: hypothetical protein ABJX82_03160 [Paracoccaceae bacterium]